MSHIIAVAAIFIVSLGLIFLAGWNAERRRK